jgi:hypothetical protein
MPLTPQDIEVGRCYRLVGLNGRSIVAKVERFVPLEIKLTNDAGAEPVVLSVTNAHFHWRLGEAEANWSKHVEILSVRDFARHASDEVQCEG